MLPLLSLSRSDPTSAAAGGLDRRVLPDEPTAAELEAFPADWLAWVKSNVIHYGLLDDDERTRLLRDARTVIETKEWEGCRGFSVTDEVKVTIAAQACLMLLGREHDHFRRVTTILIYPSAFRVDDEQWQEAGWAPLAATGMAVYRGPVILAWDAVLAEGRDPSRGANLVIHEFAHQLDYIDRHTDGTLDLVGGEAERWNNIMDDEYQRLCRAIRRGRETYLGDYAATSKSELFATAAERFFTQPAQLQSFHPELYRLLADTFRVDPLKWFARCPHPEAKP